MNENRKTNRRKRKKENQKRLQKSLQTMNVTATKMRNFAVANLENDTNLEELIEASKLSKENASERLADIISNLTNTQLNDTTKTEIDAIIELIICSVIYQLEIDELMEENANNR